MKGDEIIFYCLRDDVARAELHSTVLRHTICTYPFSKFKSFQGNHALAVQKNFERNLAMTMLIAYLKSEHIEFKASVKDTFWKTTHSDFQMGDRCWVVMNKTIRRRSNIESSICVTTSLGSQSV